MKKFVSYIVAAFLAASALAPAFAFADTATSTPMYPYGYGMRGGGMQKEMRLKMQGLQNGTATSTPMMRGQEMKKAQEEMRKRERDVRLQQMIRKMTERFSAAIKREEKLRDRIALRIEKTAQNARENGKDGKDLFAPQIRLGDATEKILEAKSALDAAAAKLQTVIASSTAKNIMKDVTHGFADVTVKLKAAHAALVDVITALKGIGNTATTTPQNP